MHLLPLLNEFHLELERFVRNLQSKQ